MTPEDILIEKALFCLRQVMNHHNLMAHLRYSERTGHRLRLETMRPSCVPRSVVVTRVREGSQSRRTYIDCFAHTASGWKATVIAVDRITSAWLEGV